MQSTVTLDPDLAAKLRTLARERGVSFRTALNSTLRLGLSTRSSNSLPYRLSSKRMGLRPGIHLDHALCLAAELEDDETVRKPVLRK